MRTSTLAKWKTATQFVVVILLLFILGFKDMVFLWSGNQFETLSEDQVYLFANISMAIVLLLTMISGFHYAFYAKHSVREKGAKTK